MVEIEVSKPEQLDEAKRLIEFLHKKGLKPKLIAYDGRTVECIIPSSIAKPPMEGWLIWLLKLDGLRIPEVDLPLSIFYVKSEQGDFWLISKAFLKYSGRRRAWRDGIKGYVVIPRIKPINPKTYDWWNFVACEDFEVIS